MPKISILTPAFIDTSDKYTWLWEMLLSLHSQHFTDWEAIIIDDCSPLSLDPLKAELDTNKFRWLRTSTNSGPSSTRNTAAALALSDALLPVDADDLLASEDTLGIMYRAWEIDKTKIIYGDIQRLVDGEKNRIINLSEYTFQNSLKFDGIMPVTAMHSKEAHTKAGGWKLDMGAGLEDVEYWIACGKAGFCGQRIPVTTLLYRKHNQSRSYNLRHVNRQEETMRMKLLDIHRDVYEGRLPMGCCGGGGSSYVPPQSISNGGIQNISTPLTDFPDGQKQWVQYLGQRDAGWQVVGDFTGIHYSIDSPGHKFEVHINDLPKFRRSGKGYDFAVGVPAPVEMIAVVIPMPVENGRYQAPEPQLAQIERLDTVGAMARGITFGLDSSVNALLEQTKDVAEVMKVQANGGQSTYDLSGLDLGEKVQQMLEAESWTVEKLAQAEPEELKAYPGVGPKIANQIVQRAKEYLV